VGGGDLQPDPHTKSVGVMMSREAQSRGGGGCSVSERDIPYEIPEPEYVEVDTMRVSRMRSNLNNWWGNQTPIAVCVRCGLRYTEDPNRDPAGEPMHEDPEDDLEVVCNDCLERAFTDSLKKGIEEVIDERLDLSENDRTSLKKVVELVVTEPEKVLELKDLGNKVRELEKQTNLLWMVYVSAILALLIALAPLVVSVVG
jgi:hypothetical protein